MQIKDLSAYEVLEQREITDVKSEGYILRHKKTGARIAILSNDDDNKVFYIGFRTPPEDETGVPHIIEHTTLCGSEKFPVKDPFVELVKGSLNTFLNAMTYPDKTIYPVASCNDQDFKNLMDVYMDAVFHPNITKYIEIFKQEGWHYELENEDDEIKINGVVYNEMKGAYSSPDETLQTEIFRSLFPDNTYSRDSGGNPVHIPELTYEYYLDFYKKYYHPSNSYIYLYGDMDLVERLEWIDKEYLGKYDYLEVDSEIRMQKPFEQIKEVCASYSVASDDSEENQTYLSFNRVIGTALDPVLYQAFDVLDYALVSGSGAPVRKALIEAGIGEDVYGSYYSGILQPEFSIVAKNANKEDKDRFLQIINETLTNIVKEGINKESILAGINSTEFKFREADFGRFPKGLLYGLQCLDSWLFDDMKPFLHLECLDTLAKLKEKTNTNFFEELIQKYLIDNTHGSHVVVSPDKGKNNREEEKLKEKLKEYKDSLSSDEIKKLVEETAALKKYQEEPSLEEDLKKIPLLSREDIKKEAMPLSNIETGIDGVKVVRHDVESNGIDYINLMFDAEDVPAEKIGYLALLTMVLGFVDTKSYKYADLANAVNIYTGGISSSVNVHPSLKDKDDIIVKYEFRIKVLQENLQKALDITKEMMLLSNLADTKRISEIVMQTKSRLQVGLSSAGNTVASMRALCATSKFAFYQDSMFGIAFYRFICEIEKTLKENPAKVTEELVELSNMLFDQQRMCISFTGDEKLYNESVASISKLLESIKSEAKAGARADIVLVKKNEGFTDGSQIQYVARTGNFAKNGFEYVGTLKLLKVILGYDYLWINVRVKGGAYGCMSAFLRTGESYLVSYRDPNLKKTNEIYEKTPEYLRNFNPDERDMTKYIIGTFSSIDSPLNPEAKGIRSMSAYLEGLTYEDIQKEREEVLNATPEDVRKLADIVESVLSDNCLCVVGNENTIKEAKDMFDSIEKMIN